MPELKADLLARLLIKVAVNAIAVATIDRCGVASELFVTLAGVGRSQFMKTLQSLFMQYFAGGEHGLLQEHGVAFVSGQQVAATGRRRMTSQLQRRLHRFIGRDPSRRCSCWRSWPGGCSPGVAAVPLPHAVARSAGRCGQGLGVVWRQWRQPASFLAWRVATEAATRRDSGCDRCCAW